MKKNTIRITAAFIIMLFATSLGSCIKGDKGDVGATGAQGATGNTGAQGNANVHVGTVSVGYSNWTYNSSSWEYYYNVSDNLITQDVVDNGTVEVFISADAGVSWNAIPTTLYFSTTQSYEFNYRYLLNELVLLIDFSDNTTTINSSFPTYEFKAVAIGGALRKAHPNTNWKDYNEVMAVANETTQKLN